MRRLSRIGGGAIWEFSKVELMIGFLEEEKLRRRGRVLKQNRYILNFY